MNMYWESPDKKIKKFIISLGTPGNKPTESTECKLKFSDFSEDLSQYTSFVLGDVNWDLGRMIEICVATMLKDEIAKFVICLNNSDVTFTMELLEFKSNGFLYEWDARKKYEYAIFQKEKGNALFIEGKIREAGFRFNKAAKILSLIPIDIQDSSEEINGVPVKNICQLKGVVYNNLASCFFKKNQWHLVIDFCDKVFCYDRENVKALYRSAIAHVKDKNYEVAHDYLKKVIDKEPENKSAIDQLQIVQVKLKEIKGKCDLMAKKMMGDIIKS